MTIMIRTNTSVYPRVEPLFVDIVCRVCDIVYTVVFVLVDPVLVIHEPV